MFMYQNGCCAEQQNRDHQPTTSYELKPLWRNYVQVGLLGSCSASRDFQDGWGGVIYVTGSKWNTTCQTSLRGLNTLHLSKLFNPKRFFFSPGFWQIRWFMGWWCYKGKMGDYFWQLHPLKLAAPFTFPGNQNLLIRWMKLHSSGS